MKCYVQSVKTFTQPNLHVILVHRTSGDGGGHLMIHVFGSMSRHAMAWVPCHVFGKSVPMPKPLP